MNPENVEEYNQQYAMLIAKCMAEINAKAAIYGSSYGQQYILKKGLKKLKRLEKMQLERNLSNCTKEIVSHPWM
ncbi:MAG: hypothetical protein ACP5M9_04545 [Candidatus Micrarchaeia archaeon]